MLYGLGLLLGVAAAQSQLRLPPGDHHFSIKHAGLARHYIVHVPAKASGAASPVMLALHGGGGTAAQFKSENGLDAVSDSGGFLAVYPDGTGPLADRLLTWNAGHNCCGSALTRKIDDVGFLAAVIEDLGKQSPIDRKRIYVTGHSNGGMMAYRLAAERADLITAIVPVGGAMALKEFRPSRAVAVMHIHSVDDPRALYHGGLGPPFPGTNNRVPHEPVMAGISAWAKANGCEASPVEGAPTRSGTGGALQTLTRVAYQRCRPGGDVVHLRLTGVGHGWPGVSARPLMQGILGRPATLLRASEEAWGFVSKYRRD